MYSLNVRYYIHAKELPVYRLVNVADAEKLAIPHLVLASKDESPDAIQGYARIIDSNGIGGQVETYGSMWHGWMGARANLDDDHSRAEYTRG